MLSVTVSDLATYINALKTFGGLGTTIVLADADQFDAIIAYARKRVSEATGDWRVEVYDEDPAEFEGEKRRRFEDRIYERARTPGTERVIYVTEQRFYVIPSVRPRIDWIDARGQEFPHPNLPEPSEPGVRRPGAGDTLWHQDDASR